MWKLVSLVVVAAAAALAFSSQHAAGQSVRLFEHQRVSMRCFQQGVEVFTLGPLQSLSQVGVERTVEFVDEQGRPGQIRVVGTTTCLVSALE